MFQRSWKTTAAGLVAAAGVMAPEIYAWTQGQPVNGRAFWVGFGIALLGFFARDKNVSTEAQKGLPEPVPPEGKP